MIHWRKTNGVLRSILHVLALDLGEKGILSRSCDSSSDRTLSNLKSLCSEQQSEKQGAVYEFYYKLPRFLASALVRPQNWGGENRAGRGTWMARARVPLLKTRQLCTFAKSPSEAYLVSPWPISLPRSLAAHLTCWVWSWSAKSNLGQSCHTLRITPQAQWPPAGTPA